MNIKYILFFILISSLNAWWELGHYMVARIAEKELKRETLSKVYKMLETLRPFFPENENSLLEASVMPDVISEEQKRFLALYHYADRPIIY